MSAAGQKRIAVMMVDPAIAKSPTYPDTVSRRPHQCADAGEQRQPRARWSRRAAPPATPARRPIPPPPRWRRSPASRRRRPIVLKRVRGVTVPTAEQYSPSEIKALSEFGIVPIIQPAMIVGGGFLFADGRLFTSDANLLFVGYRADARRHRLPPQGRPDRRGRRRPHHQAGHDLRSRPASTASSARSSAPRSSTTTRIDIPVLNILSIAGEQLDRRPNGRSGDRRPRQPHRRRVRERHLRPGRPRLLVTLLPKF